MRAAGMIAAGVRVLVCVVMMSCTHTPVSRGVWCHGVGSYVGVVQTPFHGLQVALDVFEVIVNGITI